MTNMQPSQHFSLDKPLLLATSLLASVLIGAGLFTVGGVQTGKDSPIMAAGALQSMSFSELGPLMLGVLMLVVVVSIGWPTLAGVPRVLVSRLAVLAVGIAGSVVGVIGQPVYLAYIAAFAIPLVFCLEIIQPDVEGSKLHQISGTYTGSLVALTPAMWLFVARSFEGPALGIVAVWILFTGSIVSYVTPRRLHGVGVFLASIVVAVFATIALKTSWLAAGIFVLTFTLLEWGLTKVSRVIERSIHDWSAMVFILIKHCALGVVAYALVLIVL